MKRILLISAFFLFAVFVTAHEFWLHPEKFIYQWGETINVRLLVGENYEGENWSGNQSSINSFKLYLGDAMDDMTDRISDSTSGDSLQFAIYDEGTYLLAYHSYNKYIELDSAKFLAYLQEDGLQNAIDYRQVNNEKDSMGREYYQRSVKTIFQVGTETSSLYKKETDLPLDIIPQQNPYGFKKSDSTNLLSIKILFKKEPLTNQLIKVWQRVNNQTVKTEYRSDSLGMIQVPVATAGRWMVSTVKMERLPKDSAAQWQSYWGSCTWGYE
jgi:uncharacterized GH25 family protein